jgi:hypothetical protein
MKKAYLKFLHNGDMICPWKENSSRRLRLRRFVNVAYRSDGDGGGEGDDDDEDKKKELLKTIKGLVGKQLEGRAKKEDVEAIVTQLSFLTTTKDDKGNEVKSDFPIQALRAMADEKTGVMAKLVEMGVEIQRIKTEGERQIKDMSIRAQVAAWQDKNKEVIKRIMEGEKIAPPALELRVVASPMLVSTVNSGSSPYIGRVEQEAGVNEFLRLPNTFWDFLTKGRTGAPTYVWVNKSNAQGAAAFIGPGVAKPGISFELVAESSIAKKIADSAKAGTELLQDIDGMTSFIENELRAQVMIKVNTTLMTGVNSSTVPAGIQTLSQNFAFYATAAAGIKTTNPNYMDAIRAVVGALRSGVLTGDITVFVNSIDAANMDLSKAVDSGVYLLPPFTTSQGQVIAGARVIEDNNVPVGYMQAGFMKYYRILIYKDFTVTWGWENDDFTKNLVTAVGEMRLHQFFNSIYTGAFLYDTFANVIAAITQA